MVIPINYKLFNQTIAFYHNICKNHGKCYFLGGLHTMNILKSVFSYSLSLSLAILLIPTSILAQSNNEVDESNVEDVVVTGIRSALESANAQKRNSDNLVEVIVAEDIGKLPDQNLAEVLENITGVQITRTAGVGTGVQIRGTNSNRVEINGVSTVGAGSGRSGISFEDINPAIIASLEVTKSPMAKNTEGAIGGIVNLKTIRPLDLKERLGSIRYQLEDSSLSVEDKTPRYSGAYGDTWTTESGNFGLIVTGSITEQEAVSFRPRTDRDCSTTNSAVGPDPFLCIQFLLQEQENDDYETNNLSTTFEWEPAFNENLRLSFDAVITEQERSRDQYRLQASGVSSLKNISVPSAFETVDFGVGPGKYAAALRGELIPDLDNDDDDPNLRFSSETNSRVTDTDLYRIKGELQGDRLFTTFEISKTTADSVTPNLSTTLNFINPNCPLDGKSNDNCVPFVYDLTNGLSFGVNYSSAYAPSPSDLLDPNNVVLDQVSVDRNTQKNEQTVMRLDFSYDLDWNNITSIDFGIRTSESSSEFEDIGDRIGGFSKMVDSPNGSLFSELLVQGPSNFCSGDGRELCIKNFLLLNPDLSFSDPDYVISVLQNAVIAHDPSSPDILNLKSSQNAYYDISEETTALYAQANFESGIYRGNFGFRYVDTDVDSVAFGPADSNGNRSLQSTKGSYDFILPRVNIVADINDEMLVRFGLASDIRRPGFNNLNTGFTFDPSENAAVSLGNPGLEPEEVESIDIAFEWYFAPSSVASIGYFTKDRTNIFGQDFEGALLVVDPTATGGFARETDPTCPGGGIYNPIVVPNVLGDPDTLGMCVDFTRPGNDSATTTQSGFEMALQYDLSNFEDSLGWASGFGLVLNYTTQEFSGGSEQDCTSGRGLTVLGDVCIDRGLLDFSEDAYNFTVFYEKHGLSARMRYTWREAFRTNDFGGGANTSGSSTFSFPVWTLDRGQLNASVNYDVNDSFNIGMEAVNLTEEGIDQHCVSKSGPLCFVGIPDRRILIGATYKF